MDLIIKEYFDKYRGKLPHFFLNQRQNKPLALICLNVLNDLNHFNVLGIDTPETVDPRKPVQCFGIEASRNYP